MKKALVAVTIAAAAFLGSGCQTPNHTAIKWEYKVVRSGRAEPRLDDSSQDAKLNDLGREGWELVSRETDDCWIFKRPLARTKPGT
jgi:hypothetical protein